MPMSDNAAGRLARETAVLAGIHAEDRLDDWRLLVPQPRACGTLRGQDFRVDSALTGASVLESMTVAKVRHTATRAAADAISVLHRATARVVRGDPALAERWIDDHLEALVRHAGRRLPMPVAMQRLRDELHETVLGGSFSAGWIHGDYWLGNVLFDGSGLAPGEVAGIVDWDAFGLLELPLHDVLHLVFSTRRLVSGRELGHMVRDQLQGGRWSPQEDALLERYGSWRRDGSLPERHALLLYWLRQAAMHAQQQEIPSGLRYRVWQRRNVLPVLAAL
jgi:aminoglycoside phosphotransferase (APT) family kinase protein